MNFLQLSYFLALANTENLSLTAEQLFISPPALSASISRLEKELGAPLFDRIGNRIHLNSNGRILYEYADNVFSGLNAVKEAIQENSTQKASEISIASTSYNVWVGLISAFNMAYPDVVISHTVLRLNQINSSEMRDKYDFLLTSPTDISAPKLQYEILYDDDYPVLMVYPEHRFADRKDVRLSEARDEHFIALGEEYSSRKYFDTLCEMAGFKPKIKMECDYILRAHMVSQRLGIAVGTARAVRDQVDPAKIRIIPIVDPILPRCQAIFWHSKRKETTVAKLFHDYAKQHLKDFPAMRTSY